MEEFMTKIQGEEKLREKLNERLNVEIEKMLNKDVLSLEELQFLTEKVRYIESQTSMKFLYSKLSTEPIGFGAIPNKED